MRKTALSRSMTFYMRFKAPKSRHRARLMHVGQYWTFDGDGRLPLGVHGPAYGSELLRSGMDRPQGTRRKRATARLTEWTSKTPRTAICPPQSRLKAAA